MSLAPVPFANMSNQEMWVVLDNNSATYYSGQTVTGNVLVNLKDLRPVSDIALYIRGESAVEWQEMSPKNEPVIYSASELYFENKLILYGVQGMLRLFPRGVQSFGFATTLPANVPSTFEGLHGHIRYTVKAVLSTNWTFEQQATTVIKVISPVDLNIPGYMVPINMQDEKTVGCCCSKSSGPLSMTLRTATSGYVAWEPIPFTLDVENHTDTKINAVKCLITKVIEYTAVRPASKKKKESITVCELQLGSIGAHGVDTYRSSLSIPAGPSPHVTLSNCSIIRVSYELRVETSVDGLCKFGLDMSAPIVLGTTPLTQQRPPVAQPQAPAPRPVPQSADSLPPSYEDAITAATPTSVGTSAFQQGQHLPPSAPPSQH